MYLNPRSMRPEVHGVLHLLRPEHLARLTVAEHELWPCQVPVSAYRPRSRPHGSGLSETEADSSAVEVNRRQAAAGGDGIGRAAAAAEEEEEGEEELVQAVAFVTPPERRIAAGLPPTTRLLELLVAGAEEGGVEGGYARWLAGLPAVEGEAREAARYLTSAATGQLLMPLARIRTGSDAVAPGGGGGRRGGPGEGEGEAAEGAGRRGGRGAAARRGGGGAREVGASRGGGGGGAARRRLPRGGVRGFTVCGEALHRSVRMRCIMRLAP